MSNKGGRADAFKGLCNESDEKGAVSYRNRQTGPCTERSTHDEGPISWDKDTLLVGNEQGRTEGSGSAASVEQIGGRGRVVSEAESIRTGLNCGGMGLDYETEELSHGVTGLDCIISNQGYKRKGKEVWFCEDVRTKQNHR